MEDENPMLPYSEMAELKYWSVVFPLEVSEVLTFLLPLATHWQQLGRELGFLPSVLQQIERECGQEQTEDALETVVKEWIGHVNLGPSWSGLVESLHKLLFDDVATQLLSKHETEVSLQQQLLDKDIANKEIDDIFLRKFSELVGGKWHSLASLFSFTAAEVEKLVEEMNPALTILQKWRSATRPTYSVLMGLLQAPFLLPSFYHRTSLKTRRSTVQPPHNVQSALYHSSLSGKVFTELVDCRGRWIEWKELGFSLSIPQGAIPEGQSLKVAVCSRQSSPFGLPPDLELASQAFLIAVLPDTPFTKPVTISITTSRAIDTKSLTFVAAHKPLPSHHAGKPPPSAHASLRVLQGGDFNPSAGVGTVSLDHLPAVIAVAIKSKP